jgi:DNA-binding response OmpR family regulator
MVRALGEDYKVSTVLSLRDFYQETVNKPRLIIYDISPPCSKDMKNCRRLKKHPLTKDIPLIAISATTWEKEKREIFECTGAEYVLTKPFSIDEFRNAVYSWA